MVDDERVYHPYDDEDDFPPPPINVTSTAASSVEEELKAAVHYHVTQFIEQKGNMSPKMSTRAVAALGELTYGFAVSHARELKHFATHARRTSINISDVVLCARKSATLHARMKAAAEALQATKPQKKRRSKKTDQPGDPNNEEQAPKRKSDTSKPKAPPSKKPRLS